jgi:hypothetical protein
MNKAKFVTEVDVQDPDTGGWVSVAIFKCENSAGMFGVDASYLEHLADEDEDLIVVEPYNEIQTQLVDY